MLSNDEIRHRIDYEILVDCYDEYEASTAWFTYFDDTLEFPFQATASLKKRDGSVEQTEVTVLGLASDSDAFLGSDFYLTIEHGSHEVHISYSQLANVRALEATLEAFQVWEYQKENG